MTSHTTAQDAPVLGHSVYGQGPEKVLLLHDWMGDAANYEPLIPYLDPVTYTYVFADVRGYGRSRHLPGEFSAGEVATTTPRLKSVVAITPVAADGYPADQATKAFLWNLIGS